MGFILLMNRPGKRCQGWTELSKLKASIAHAWPFIQSSTGLPRLDEDKRPKPGIFPRSMAPIFSSNTLHFLHTGLEAAYSDTHK